MGCNASTQRGNASEPVEERAATPVKVKPKIPDPVDDKLKEEADAVFFQATFHFHHGELDDAHSLCTKALEVLSSHKRAFLLRGECLLKLGRLDEALRDTTAAINLGHREGHRARGHVYLEQGNLKLALEDLSLAVAIEPSDYRAWALRARAHQKLGNKNRARMDMEQASKEDPNDEAHLCIVCLDERRATRLNPCEHSVLCAECAKECKEHHGICPICNTAIKAIEYGNFMGTFAPSDSTNFAAMNLAAAVAKAKEELAREGHLVDIDEAGPLGDLPEDEVAARARTPSPRDYSGYTLGGPLDDSTATPLTSSAATPQNATPLALRSRQPTEDDSTFSFVVTPGEAGASPVTPAEGSTPQWQDDMDAVGAAEDTGADALGVFRSGSGYPSAGRPPPVPRSASHTMMNNVASTPVASTPAEDGSDGGGGGGEEEGDNVQEVSRQSVSEEHMDVMRTAASVMDLEAGGLPGTPISLSPPPTRSGMQTSANTTPHGGGGSGGGGGSTSTVAPLPAVPSIRVGV